MAPFAKTSSAALLVCLLKVSALLLMPLFVLVTQDMAVPIVLWSFVKLLAPRMLTAPGQTSVLASLVSLVSFVMSRSVTRNVIWFTALVLTKSVSVTQGGVEKRVAKSAQNAKILSSPPPSLLESALPLELCFWLVRRFPFATDKEVMLFQSLSLAALCQRWEVGNLRFLPLPLLDQARPLL